MARKRLLMDTWPLRHSPDFRRLWVGQALSNIGGQMTAFAVALQVYTITHSSLAVGGVGLALAVPLVALGLFGGSIADAVDRRRLVLVSTSVLALFSVALAVQAFLGLRQVWVLYLLVGGQSLVGAINAPARRTFTPRLLPPERLTAGAALNMMAMHLAVTTGPLLAGALTAAGGLKLCYVVDAATFLAALYGVDRLPAMPPQGGATRAGLRAVGEGLAFIRRSRVLTGALLADLSATVLAMPFALFPAINAERFGGSPHTLGLLMAAPAIGGLIGSALSGPVGHVSRHGRAMLLAGAVWGAGLAGFGLARALWLAVGLLVVAGVADVLAVVFRTTIVQAATPDRYRGRTSAAEYVVGAGFPQLGNFRAGVVGSAFGSTVGMVSGGLSAIAGAALIYLALPGFIRYRAATPDSARPAPPEAALAPVDDPPADGPPVPGGHEPGGSPGPGGRPEGPSRPEEGASDLRVPVPRGRPGDGVAGHAADRVERMRGNPVDEGDTCRDPYP